MTGVRNPNGEWVAYGYDSRVVTEQRWRFDEDDDTYAGTTAITVRLHSVTVHYTAFYLPTFSRDKLAPHLFD